MRLTENFTLEELTASSVAKRFNLNNSPSVVEIEKLKELCEKILQPIRTKFGEPILITSGFRNSSLNRIVGGSPSSQHLKGEAADLVCVDNQKLWNLILEMIKSGSITVGQLINEKKLSWIHISLPTHAHKNQILYL